MCHAVCVCCPQVKNIVACIAASEYLGSETKLEDWSFGQWDISALFGAVPLNHKGMKKGKVNGMPPQIFNKVTQVCLVLQPQCKVHFSLIAWRRPTPCWLPGSMVVLLQMRE